MLPRPLRLSAQRDFTRIFRRGVSLSTPFFTVRALVSPLKNPRIGVVVSNKISKKATVRNHIKRHLRASAYEERQRIPVAIDIVLIAKPAIIDSKFADIKAQIIKSFSQLADTISRNQTTRT